MRKPKACATTAALAFAAATIALHQPMVYGDEIASPTTQPACITRDFELQDAAEPFKDLAELHAFFGIPDGEKLDLIPHDFSPGSEVTLPLDCIDDDDREDATVYRYDISSSGKATKVDVTFGSGDDDSPEVSGFGKLGRGEYYLVFVIADNDDDDDDDDNEASIVVQYVRVGDNKDEPTEEPSDNPTDKPSDDVTDETSDEIQDDPTQGATPAEPANPSPTPPRDGAAKNPVKVPSRPVSPAPSPASPAPDTKVPDPIRAAAGDNPVAGRVPDYIAQPAPPADGPFVANQPIFDELATIIVPRVDDADDADGATEDTTDDSLPRASQDRSGENEASDSAGDSVPQTPVEEPLSELESLSRGDFVLQPGDSGELPETVGPLAPRDGDGQHPYIAEPPVIITKNENMASQSDGNESLLLGVVGGVALVIGGVIVALYRLRP